MVEVRLHGSLAKAFGKVWHFDISSPREAFQALCGVVKGFHKKVLELDGQNLVFRVRTKHHDYTNDDVDLRLGGHSRLDIIPIVRGASAGVRFVVGAILVAAGVFTGQPTLATMGASLMLGSVVEWLTPLPKKAEQQAAAQSWTINGPSNTTDAGVPVPIIYGEVLTGSQCISAGVAAAQLTPSGAVAPAATIGGPLALSGVGYSDYGSTATVTQTYTVGVFNLTDPISVVWSYSGFAGATVQLTPVGRSVQLSVTGGTSTGNYNYSGTLTATVTGIETSTTSGEPPKTTTVSTSVTLTSTITIEQGNGISGN
jgi:predicted phage tail protein